MHVLFSVLVLPACISGTPGLECFSLALSPAAIVEASRRYFTMLRAGLGAAWFLWEG